MHIVVGILAGDIWQGELITGKKAAKNISKK
jgi:hypothetical protein